MVCVLDNIGAFFISMEKIMTNLYRDREWLYQKYSVKKWSTIEIGALCKCSDETIRKWLKRYNIKIRTQIEARRQRKIIPIEQRFWKYINKNGLNGCWTWIGAKNKNGYGQIDNKGTHRISWELHNGPIPKGLCVCHKCDEPSCVNPEHLFLGTFEKNSQDMTNKNRQAKGEKINNSKLKEWQVLEIRVKYETGKYTTEQLAGEYNVNKSTIRRIVKKITWKHI